MTRHALIVRSQNSIKKKSFTFFADMYFEWHQFEIYTFRWQNNNKNGLLSVVMSTHVTCIFAFGAYIRCKVY